MNNIKTLRIAKGLTQRKVAEAIGVSHNLVCQWETDVRRPEFDSIIKLAEFFNITADEVIDIERKETGYDTLMPLVEKISVLDDDNLKEFVTFLEQTIKSQYKH